jgi:hypothetical protein
MRTLGVDAQTWCDWANLSGEFQPRGLASRFGRLEFQLFDVVSFRLRAKKCLFKIKIITLLTFINPVIYKLFKIIGWIFQVPCKL